MLKSLLKSLLGFNTSFLGANMGIKDKLIIYIYNKGNELEQEEKDLKTSLRMSALDNLDHYEILLHRIRIQAWNEFIQDLYRIVINCK